MPKTVHVLYSCDEHRSYSSMDPNALIGVLGSDGGSETLLRSYIARDNNIDVKQAYELYQENILDAVINGLVPYYHIEVKTIDELN